MKSSSGLSWTIWIVLCGCVASLDDLFIERPIITTGKDPVSLDLGTNVSLNCVSEFRITWKPFAGFTGIYEVNYKETPENDLRFESTIDLINVTHYYVGWFWCVVNSTLPASDEYSIDLQEKMRGHVQGTAGKYVFVKEPKKFLVPHSDYRIMNWYDEQYLVIPCKPTSLDTKPKLIDYDGHEVDIQLHDNFVGYLVKFSAVAEIYGKNFTCRVESPTGYSAEKLQFNISYHVPTLKSDTGLCRTQGQQLTLTCQIEILKGDTFTIKWTLPHGNNSFAANRVTDHPSRPDLQIGCNKIIVEDVAVGKDDGNYTCEVTDGLMKRMRNQIFIEILKKDDDSVDIYTLSGNYRMEISSLSKEAVWEVKYKGNPKPILSWHDTNGEIITTNWRYRVEDTNDFTTLKILHLKFEDSGNYTLKANNGINSTEKRFELRVMGSPSVHLKARSDRKVKLGSSVELICYANGYPLPKIKWAFTPCNITLEWGDCETRRRTTIEEKDFQTTSMNVSSQISVLNYNVTEHGKVECIAINSEGQNEASKLFLVGGIDEPFKIWGVDLHRKIVAGDNVTAVCGVSPFIYFSSILWQLNDETVESTDGVTVESAVTEFSYRSMITWTKIITTHSGIYECSAYRKHQKMQSRTLNITVHEAKKPEIADPMETFKITEGEPIRLACNFIGLPVPTIEWYKNGSLIEDGNGFSFSTDKQSLKIEKLKMEDEGEFKCIVNNREGPAEKLITLIIIKNDKKDLPNISNATAITSIITVTALSSVSLAWIIAVAVLVFISIICTIFFFVRFRRIRRDFESFLNKDGKPDCINPNLAVHEQADLLPYDKKYEFPKEQLKLGKQLGAGAFGVVVQALATGLLPHEEKTTVAVKMLKQSADNEQVRALTIELKIMVHLGRNVNVVNLLGAVTKNIAKRELMIIVEYCRFGNLQTFLLKHRKWFVNQVDSVSDSIDGTVLTNEQRRSYYSSRPVHSSRVDSSEGPATSFAEMSFITSTSVPSTAGDYNHPMRIVTTSDLVSWSFQVARGMEYLSSRKVLHGDLAARNVLLCDDNVVKICDFGLARSLYKCTDYIKDAAVRLPVKWLAIESICDRVFNTLSDVWSFGIFMWELFSLGETPYPGMEVNEDFCLKLKDGHRMTKPINATREIYDLMLHCWDANPESRPSFNALEERLKKLLPIAVALHYIDISEQYVKMYAPQGQIMRPTEEEEVVPVGGNSQSMEPSTAPPGYLPMKPLLGDGVSDIRGTINAVKNPCYDGCVGIGQP